MLRLASAVTTIILLTVSISVGALAWEVNYLAETGLLPEDASPAWKFMPSSSSTTRVVDGGVLQIQYSAGDQTYPGYYGREAMAIPKDVPVTMEAVMRLTPSSGKGCLMAIQTGGIYTTFLIYPDHFIMHDMGTGYVTVNQDFTEFRTIRIACDVIQQYAYVWVDGQHVFSAKLPGVGGQSGIYFGAYAPSESFDSYWKRVSYSKTFEPVPEPASFLAILGGLIGMAAKRRLTPR